MHKLKNTDHDRNILNTLLVSGVKPRAKVTLGCFTSMLASSLEMIDYEGVITKIDLDSGYCEWENMEGITMPFTNINSITLYKI